MPRNGITRSKDELVCELEFRQTRTQQTMDQLEIRRGVVESSLLRLQRLYQNSPIGFITYDHASRILDINQAAIRLLKITPAAVVGLSMTVLISNTSAARFMEHLRRSRRTGGGSAVSTEVEMIAGQGGKVDVQLVTSTVTLDSGRIFETALIDLTAQKAASDAVAKAKEYAEVIVTTIPYPVVVLDQRARIVSANAAFYYLFQTSESQVVHWPMGELPDVTWLSPTLEAAFQKAINEGRPVDGLILRAEIRRGSLLTLNVNARRLTTHTGSNREFLLVAFEDITRRQRAEEDRELVLQQLQESQLRLEARVKERTQELGKSYEKLRALGEQLVLAHESEQRRIARELHDQIGQDLTALKITLSRGKTGKAEQALEALQEAEAMTDELLQTVRNICGTLRPQVLDDLGLIAGLQWHVRTFSARTGLDITFDFGTVDETRLSPIVKSTIFRVIQEALTNVSRHAETTTASVMLAMRRRAVEFSIRDGGKGFDAAAALKTGTSGVSGMRERLSLVQGVFEISSFPQQGTVIRATIPLPPLQDNQDTQQTEMHGRPNQLNRNNNGKKPTNQSSHSRRSSSSPQRA